MIDDRIAALLEPVLAPYALELEEVDVRPAGKRRVVKIVVDGDGPKGRGPLLDDIASATRAISEVLDQGSVMGETPYTLEVSSRGVSRPLNLPRHWRRNRGRLVAVSLVAPEGGGEKLVGRITASDESEVTLDVDGTERRLSYAEIAQALVQVELNPPKHLQDELDDLPDDEHDDEQDDEHEPDGAPAADQKEN